MKKNVMYVVLLLGLGGYFAYDTYYPEYVKWDTEINDLQKKIDTAKQNAPKLKGLKDEELRLKQKLKASLSQLPSGAELDDLLVMVLPILEECGIQSNRVQSKSVEPAQLQQVYRIHPIKIGGIKDLSMATIVDVLHKIRDFRRIINVKSVRISRTAKDHYTLDLDLETYSYIETEGEDLGLESVPEPAETPAQPKAATETTAMPAPAGGAAGESGTTVPRGASAIRSETSAEAAPAAGGESESGAEQPGADSGAGHGARGAAHAGGAH